MLLQGKIDRAMKWLQEKNKDKEKENLEGEERQDLQKVEEKYEVEKKDYVAMFLAALIVFVPAILIVLLILCAVMWLFFFH